jgi:hypothetical protein
MPSPDSVIGLRSSRKPAAEKRARGVVVPAVKRFKTPPPTRKEDTTIETRNTGAPIGNKKKGFTSIIYRDREKECRNSLREKSTPTKRNSLKPLQQYEIQRPINPKPCEKLNSKNPSTQKRCVRLASHKRREAFAVRM